MTPARTSAPTGTVGITQVELVGPWLQVGASPPVSSAQTWVPSSAPLSYFTSLASVSRTCILLRGCWLPPAVVRHLGLSGRARAVHIHGRAVAAWRFPPLGVKVSVTGSRRKVKLCLIKLSGSKASGYMTCLYYVSCNILSGTCCVVVQLPSVGTTRSRWGFCFRGSKNTVSVCLWSQCLVQHLAQ